DTLTLADDRLEAFYDNPNALRDYFRDIGRMVLAAEGRKANDSHADCYQYFCVPEYGTANGRLHFHAVHFMRTLPTGSVDPNRSEERFSRNAETDLVCRLLLEKKKKKHNHVLVLSPTLHHVTLPIAPLPVNVTDSIYDHA